MDVDVDGNVDGIVDGIVDGVEVRDRDRDGAGVEGGFEDEAYYTIRADFKICKRSRAVRNIYFF